MSIATPQIVETNFFTYSKKGRKIGKQVKMSIVNGRIEFIKSPFELKDEIKAMRGSQWHGRDDEPRKIWSVDDCFRNRFQIARLEGKNPYVWFDQDLVHQNYDRPLKFHQKDMADRGLTYHFQIWAGEMGVGKTLAAIEVIERSGKKKWWWVGPKRPLEAIRMEFKKWGLDPSIHVELMTYDKFSDSIQLALSRGEEIDIPEGIIFDESTRIKSGDSKRSNSAQYVTDLMRAKYGYQTYVILMTGTPQPNGSGDWWSQCEVCFPGFIREGSEKSFTERLAFVELQQFGPGGGMHKEILGWRDDENKCDVCGVHKNDHDETWEGREENHQWLPSKNEVAYLFERMKGLVVVWWKKDCLDLPDKQYRVIKCEPNPSTLRVAKALTASSQNAVTGITLLRELSDGFQYTEERDGDCKCSYCNGKGTTIEFIDSLDPERSFSSRDMLDPELVARLKEEEVECPQCEGRKTMPSYKRVATEIPCPKEDALIGLLEENEQHGRVVIFAGFTGSVDRCVKICLQNSWDVVRCDGRGFEVQRMIGGRVVKVTDEKPLEYWANRTHRRVAFVSHPESGGQGLTLTEACMAIFWSNSFKSEFRTQAEDRIHRIGLDENRGAIIVDLIHLPTDKRVLYAVQNKRRMEKMSMGDVSGDYASVV